uniref:Ribosomal protein S4 n=1 Tax=Phalansterium sp. PJK-2012 TaxID=1267188 RepID=T1QE02_9EUKA|nr:ribosomal protein S4 [Phalansterium sp. PJK-2012]
MTNIVNKYRTLRTCRGDVWGNLIPKLWMREKKKPLKAMKPLKKTFTDSRRRRNWANLLLLDHRRGSKYKRRGKKTTYGAYVTARQRLRNFYGMMRERQLRAIAKSALKGQSFNIGGSSVKFANIMELRIDTVLWRARFYDSVRTIRQKIIHGHVYVNGAKITRPSYVLKMGDCVNVIKPTVMKELAPLCRFFYFPPLGSHLEVDYKNNFTLYVVDEPALSEIFYPFEGSFYDILWFYDVKYGA